MGANSLHKKLQEDKERKARLGGFGIHSLVGDHGKSTLDKALDKLESKGKKTKVVPAPKATMEKQDFGAAMQAMKWGSGTGSGGKNLSAAAGKALVASKKQVVPIPSTDFSFDERDGVQSSEDESSTGSEMSQTGPGTEGTGDDSSVVHKNDDDKDSEEESSANSDSASESESGSNQSFSSED